MNTKQYDAAVIGGGVAAVLYACALAQSDRKVILLADSTSLMHEIGLSRLSIQGISELAGRYPLVQSWVDLLKGHDAIQGDRMEQILVQLLADKFVQSHGVDILFEVTPLHIVHEGDDAHKDVTTITGMSIATREGIIHIPCHSVIDCTHDGRVIREWTATKPVADRDVFTEWTLTCLQDHAAGKAEELDIQWPDISYKIRIAPSYWEDELEIKIAAYAQDPDLRSEIGFLGTLEKLLVQIKEKSDYGIGSLLHVSERAWHTPSELLDPNSERSSIITGDDAWCMTENKRLIGIGCWLPESHRIINQAAQWNKGSTALRLLTIGALEAAALN